MAVLWHGAVDTREPKRAAAAVVAAVALAGSLRYAVHVVSGAVFFGEYAPAGQPVWVYSALYNLYVPLSAALALVAALVLLPALERSVPSKGARQ